MTVTGPVDPAALGMTVMHEHIFIDFTRGLTAGPAYNTPATDVAFFDQKLTLENVHLVRENGVLNKDNWLLADVDVAVKELFDFKSWGGGAIVDVTNIGIGRDPVALRHVSPSPASTSSWGRAGTPGAPTRPTWTTARPRTWRTRSSVT